MNSFVLCGMFRSGSTFLSRALDANPGICCAMDPCAYFFKNVRNHFMAKYSDLDFNLAGPLSDNFFSSTPKMADAIRHGSLDMPISKVDLSDLKAGIIKHGAEFSSLLMPKISAMTAETYRDAFTHIINSIHECYGDEKTKVNGFKVVWAEEFMPLLLNSIPDLKVIYIIRDPRAVIASNLAVKEGKYPYLFLTRQWRKSATYSILYSQLIAEFKARVLLVRYEDVVDDFENMCRKMCDFLKVDFHSDMTEIGAYKAGDGGGWKPNSSYGKKQGVYKSSKEKWRDILDERAIDYLQKLLQYEMKMLGYLDADKPHQPLSLTDILAPPIVPSETLADWILQTGEGALSTNDFNLKIEMFKEDLRLRMLSEGDSDQAWDKELIKSAFIDEGYYQLLKNYLIASPAKGLF